MAEGAKSIKGKALSMSEKLAIINEFNAQALPNKSAFAKAKGIPGSTLRTLLKNELLSQSTVCGTKRKKKSGKFEDLEV